MKSNFQIQLSWTDTTGRKREPRLSLPIAFGREFAQMPVEIHNRPVSRMVLNSPEVALYHASIDWDGDLLIIQDRHSTSGTFVNGKRQERCILNRGDELQIGADKISVTWSGELPAAIPRKHSQISALLPHLNLHHLSLTDVFPIASKQLNLHKNSFLLPGIVTVIFVVAMLVARKMNELFFLYILAAYLASVSHYLIHKACHKDKPWWLLFSVALATGLPLLLGLHPELLATGNNILDRVFEIVLVKAFFQELLKAVPVLLVYFLGTFLRSPNRELIGVNEPMDGILLGTAAATGFALVETMLDVHEAIERGNSFDGLTLLIPQILGDISGQVAYSGYFGYFIGLSALKSVKRWQILGIGYSISAAIHSVAALGTLMQGKENHTFIASIFLAIIGSLSYVCLMAAILKARHLSDRFHRSVNHQ